MFLKELGYSCQPISLEMMMLISLDEEKLGRVNSGSNFCSTDFPYDFQTGNNEHLEKATWVMSTSPQSKLRNRLASRVGEPTVMFFFVFASSSTVLIFFFFFASSPTAALLQEPPLLLQYHNDALLKGTATVNLIWYGKLTPVQRSIIIDFLHGGLRFSPLFLHGGVRRRSSRTVVTIPSSSGSRFSKIAILEFLPQVYGSL